MKHITDFVLELQTYSNINLFITDLKEEDTTVTMYSKSYPAGETVTNRRPNSTSGDTSKVDRVCDALKSALEETDDKKYEKFVSSFSVHIHWTSVFLRLSVHFFLFHLRKWEMYDNIKLNFEKGGHC